MSKTLAAQCALGIVTVEGLPVVGTSILSDGKGQSSGIAVIDEDRSYYIANTTPDLATTLDKVASALATIASALTQAATGLTAHGGAFAGLGVSPDPALSAITAITNAVTELNTPVTGPIAALNALKGNLQ